MNTTFFKNKVINNIFTTDSSKKISDYYLGFSTTEPSGENENITEPVGNGYSRVLIDGFTVSTDGYTTNQNDLALPIAIGDWGVLTHYVIFDAITDGNVLMYGKLNENITISIDNALVIPLNSLKLSID